MDTYTNEITEYTEIEALADRNPAEIFNEWKTWLLKRHNARKSTLTLGEYLEAKLTKQGKAPTQAVRWAAVSLSVNAAAHAK